MNIAPIAPSILPGGCIPPFRPEQGILPGGCVIPPAPGTGFDPPITILPIDDARTGATLPKQPLPKPGEITIQLPPPWSPIQ